MPLQKKLVPKSGEAALKLFNATFPSQPEGENDMATATAPKKRKRARAQQTKIEGTYDEIPQDLKDKVEEYVDTLRERLKTQKEEDVLRAEVIELMHEHKIENIPLDEGTEDEKRLILERGDEKIKIKPLRKAKASKED